MDGSMNENLNRLTDLELCLTENILLRLQLERDARGALRQTNNTKILLERLLHQAQEQREVYDSLSDVVPSPNSASPPPSPVIPAERNEELHSLNEELHSLMIVPYRSVFMQDEEQLNPDSLSDNVASNNFYEQTHNKREIESHVQSEIRRLQHELKALEEATERR